MRAFLLIQNDPEEYPERFTMWSMKTGKCTQLDDMEGLLRWNADDLDSILSSPVGVGIPSAAQCPQGEGSEDQPDFSPWE